MNLASFFEILFIGLRVFFPASDVKLLEQVLGAYTQANYQDSQVTEVVDGDTFKIWLNGEEKTVRLLGIDTPETKHPQKGTECFGPEASAKLTQLIDQKVVQLKSDSLQPDLDKYGRLLRYVYLPDGTNVNQVLVQEGFAKTYTSQKSDEMYYYLDLEAEAKQQNLGLWEACN